jgi:hypothetical protein
MLEKYARRTPDDSNAQQIDAAQFLLGYADEKAR